MIRVENLGVSFPGFEVRDVSFEVPKGGFFALMGPTGSGKTIVLESVAGLTSADQGRIFIGGRDVTDLPPERRRVGMVYQDHSLFPHLSVLDNVTYGQRYHGFEPHQGLALARELLEMLDLSRVSGRKPANLSGGEKQRAAIARALAINPEVILLDEPLSSLDPQFRDGLRTTLGRLHKETGVTFLMVTHDFVDALTLADRAAVIRCGEIEQQGAVRDIFQRPGTSFVANFVGMRNLVPARSAGRGRICFAGHTMALNGREIQDQGDVQILAALRPEDMMVRCGADFPRGWEVLAGTLKSVRREGFSMMAVVDCAGARMTGAFDPADAARAGEMVGNRVHLGFSGPNLHLIRCDESVS